MQASVGERCFMTKLFQFVSEMQNTAFEIKDHRVIGGAMEQCFSNLFFKIVLPPFKNSNIWFRQDFLPT